MIDKATASIIHHFSTIVDPRVDRRKVHRLSDILFITLCATICGADNWVAIERFGKAKETWFKIEGVIKSKGSKIEGVRLD